MDCLVIVKKYIKFILLVVLCLQSSALPIDISKNNKEILAKSYILLEKNKSNISQIKKNKNFKEFKSKDINVGLKRDSTPVFLAKTPKFNSQK